MEVSKTHSLVIFDGECGICRTWTYWIRQRTPDSVHYHPYQKVHTQFPTIPQEAFQNAVHLIEPNGSVFSGAEAVYKVLAYGGFRFGHRLYAKSAVFRWVSKIGYRFVSQNRSRISALTGQTECELPA